MEYNKMKFSNEWISSIHQYYEDLSIGIDVIIAWKRHLDRMSRKPI
ncbi:MAG: hypothetical protein HQM12_23260 [SAR324 cluster bacterium]|nr:hypothetical protein [SAR324 cluster bacterium]